MNLKQKLSKKLKKSGGFTLIEMLIVVAIIAILVAVSIPMVGSALEKARVATDQANERAAKGAAMVEYLTEGKTGTVTYAYDAEDGVVYDTTTESDKLSDIKKYGQCSKHKGGYVQVEITAADVDTDMTVNVTWAGVGDENKNPDGITATEADT